MKLNVVDPFSGIEAAPNALLIDAEATTMMFALDVLPVPPFVELTCTMLVFAPTVVPVTFIETVQLALGASDEPLRLADEAPATAVVVPTQVLFKLFGVAISIPAGRLSVNATPLRV